MKRFGIAVALGLLVIVLFACASAASKSEGQGGVSSGTVQTVPGRVPAPTIAVPAPAPAPFAPSINAPTTMTAAGSKVAPPAAAPAFSADQAAPTVPDRMVVRTGALVIMVDNVSGSLDRITGQTTSYGGYVVSSQSGKQGDKLVGAITVRVPAARFDDAMKAFRDLAIEVTSETSSSTDVTQQYIDLQGRLTSLQATYDQLLKIMQQATKVEDILAIQREITNTQTQIEQTKGQMQYLERTAAMSLINVTLQQGTLVINFTADKALAMTGDQLRFTSQVSGGYPPYSYQWDFGDGQTSNSASPTHAYQSGGSYTVSLKVTDDKRNTDTKVREQYLAITSGWSPGSIATSAWNGLAALGRALVNIAIYVGIFSPVWIVVLAVLYLIRRARRKRKGAA